MRIEYLGVGTIALALVASGCGSNEALNSTTLPNPTPQCQPSSAPKFAYVLNYADATISMYSVNSCTGVLTSTSPASIPTGIKTGINAEGMVIDPKSRFLYIANLVSNANDQATISMFTINPTTGLLTPTTPAMVATGFFPQGIAIDPSGRFVYTANSDDNTISMFTVDQLTGILAPTDPASIFVPPVFTSRSLDSSPGSVTADPTGHFIYVIDQDNGSISSFNVNANTGILTPTTPSGVVSGAYPLGLIVDPTDKFAYVPDEVENSIDMYTVDASTGILTPNPAFSVPGGNQPGWIAIHPSSKFVYVVNRSDNDIFTYDVDPTSGTLSYKSSISTGVAPYPITLDVLGNFAYVGNQQENTVSIFKIGSDGTLSATGKAATGGDPVNIVLTH